MTILHSMLPVLLSITLTAEPRFSVVWIEPAAIASVASTTTPKHLSELTRQSMQAMNEIGIDTIILAYAEYMGTFFYPSELSFFDRDMNQISKGSNAPFDVYGTVLEEADRLGMKVFLGIGRQGDTNLLWEFDKPGWKDRLTSALDIAQRVASELDERFNHHPCFVGWYFSHEMNDLPRSRAYYDPLARHCKSLGNKRQVLISPAGTPVLTKNDIARSDVDIFAYQDAVGAGYLPYQYTYDPSRRIAMLQEIFNRYADLHAGTDKEIWANVEVWQMDGSKGYSSPFPASWSRVKQQLSIEAPHVARLSAYAWHGFMQPASSPHEKEIAAARQLLLHYRDYLREE